MSAVAEVELQLIGRAEEADEWIRDVQYRIGQYRIGAEPGPGMSGGPLFKTDSAGPEVVAVVVTLAPPVEFSGLAAAISEWAQHRRSDITVEVSATGSRVRLRGGAEISRVLDVLHGLPPAESPEVEEDETGLVTGAANFSGGEVKRGTIRLPGDREYYVLGFPGSPGFQDDADASTVPVTIYLSDEGIHQQVEAAIEALLAGAGLQIESRDDPVVSSWFRRMLVRVKNTARPAAREATLGALHVADTRLVLAQDAAVTAALLQNLGPVLGALQPTKDAVIRAGALLIVKVDWVVNVFQLTAAQQAVLDHRPQLAWSPSEIITALNLIPEDKGEAPQALH
jgi:hypothetical protein